MEKRASFLLLLLLVSMAVAMANIMDDAREKLNNPETAEKAKEEASSWADWAKEKFNNGFGFMTENNKDGVEEGKHAPGAGTHTKAPANGS